MTAFLFAVGLLLATTVHAASESVKTVPPSPPILTELRIDGASALSEEALRSLLEWREGEPLDESALREGVSRVLEAYRERGYLFAEVTPKWRRDRDTVRVALQISEGRKARLSEITFVGLERMRASEVRRLLRVKPGFPLDEARWRKGMNRLLRRYAEMGHPFAAITTEVARVDPTEGTYALRIHVDEGPLTTIEAVEIEGLEKTRKELVRRMIPIRPGDVYDERRIEASRYILLNSGFFASIHPSDIRRGSAKDRVVYRVRVEEAKTARFVGLLGYAPPGVETETPQLTGLIEASDGNLFGTGRSVAFRWESGENRTTHLTYREPYLFGWNLAATLEWDAERFAGVRRRLALGRIDWSLSAHVQFGLGAQAIEAGSGRGGGLLAEVRFDTRDYRPNPIRGFALTLRGEALFGAVRFDRIGVDGWAFFPLAERHVIATRMALGRLFGMDIPPTEWYFLGGSATLRGYREREFRGMERGLGTLEYRLLTGRDSRVYLFFDVGDVRDDGTRIGPKIGYGFGANLESRGGLIQLQYGLAPGISPFNGKVHIRLGTAF